jgi:hypothetical protein
MRNLKLLLLGGFLLVAPNLLAQSISGGGTPTGSGTVTSVGISLPSIFTVTGSPVTSVGTLTGTLASESANTIFAAPNGSAGAPSFRAIVGGDLPPPSTSVLGGVLSSTAGANQFQTGISTAGAPAFAQPTFTNLSGTIAAAQIPFGTTTGTVAQGNDSRIAGALQTTGGALTGATTAVTPAVGDNSTNIATTAYVRAATLPTRQIFTASGTFTTPANALWLWVRGVGAGSGGGGSAVGAANTASTAGGATSFGTSLLTANGGGAVVGAGSQIGAVGGTASVTGPAVGVAFAGSNGLPGVTLTPTNGYALGGGGGVSPFGGAGAGGANSVGTAAVANSGSGGGAGGTPSFTATQGQGGGGGAAGGYFDATIPNPSGNYTVTIGTGGAGGVAGTGGIAGGRGGDGLVIVEVHYLP